MVENCAARRRRVYTVLGHVAVERLGADLSSVTVVVGDSRLPQAGEARLVPAEDHELSSEIASEAPLWLGLDCRPV